MTEESKKLATLFVRNLSPKTTSSDLETHFGGIGPIRRCFVVTNAGTASCKGFGFVHFALPEDAASSIESLQRSLLHGRKITLDLAKPRMRNGGRNGEEADADGGLPKKRPRVAPTQDADKIVKVDEKPKKKIEEKASFKKAGALAGSIAMRTVIISSVTKGAVISEQEARDAVAADDSESKFESCMLTSNGTEARCVFSSWPKAGKAAARAHGEKYTAVVEAMKGGKRSRLIVRNLPFVISLKELRDACEKVATVRELTLAPSKILKIESEKLKHASDDAVTCGGYAFVEYFLAADAKFAISKLNGAKIGGRIVAVDMAIGKASYIAQAEAEAKEEENQHDKDDNSDKDSEEDSPGGSDSEEGTSLAESEGDEIGENMNQKDTQVVKREQKMADAPGKAPISTEDELARTVFVRNLLFETSATELWKTMAEEFGTVEQAVLVMHPLSGRPRGTAFVRFTDPASAEKAVARAGQGDRSREKPASKAPKHSGLSLQGRELFISMAVDRSKAKELGDSSMKNKKAEDPRNLKLAWVGMITPGSEEAKPLSDEEMKRRAAAAKKKKDKLSHNPNAFVSDVRLSVRNLPRDFDDKMLKQMFLSIGSGKSSKETKGDSKSKPVDPVRITHCAVVRDPERKNRSKGYGFVQFSMHEHALTALHAVNNNPKAMEMLIRANPKALKIDSHRERLLRKQWGDKRRLMVEFSVEDKRKVMIIEKIKERGKKLSEEHKQRKLEELPDSESQPVQKSKSWQQREGKPVHHKKLSKSEKKSAMKRQRAEQAEEQEKNAKVRKVSNNDSSQSQKRKQSRKETSSRFNEDPSFNLEDMRESEKADPKPRKSKKKRSAAELEKDNKFDSLVDSYKRKLAKPTSLPRWFT